MQLSLQRPTTSSLPDQNIIICNPNETTSAYAVWAGIITEFFIDTYVTIRLIQILRKANQTVQITSYTGHKNNRTLFTAVMYWNFIRLFVSTIFHAVPIINQKVDDGYNETLVLTSI